MIILICIILSFAIGACGVHLYDVELGQQKNCNYLLE